MGNLYLRVGQTERANKLGYFKMTEFVQQAVEEYLILREEQKKEQDK